MRRIVLSLLCAAGLLAAAPLSAQLLLNGVLLNGRSRHPVARATIVLVDSAGSEVGRTQTRGDGWFELQAPAPAAYTVRAELAGDVVATGEVRVEGRDPVRVQMYTRSGRVAAAARRDSAVALAPLVVVGAEEQRYLRNAGFYDRQKVGTGVFMTGEQFARLPGARTVDRFEGIRRIFARPSGSSGWVLTQGGGGRRCTVSLWIDGVRMPAEVLNGISPGIVEAVEVYDGHEVPLRFSPVNRGGRAPCGAVVVWLKTPAA
ncbi:MAG TPA: carboxypeptidase-like regulatory domain-containing protein [Longimicrobium sp.]|jgi:hypothetical protein